MSKIRFFNKKTKQLEEIQSLGFNELGLINERYHNKSLIAYFLPSRKVYNITKFKTTFIWKSRALRKLLYVIYIVIAEELTKDWNKEWVITNEDGRRVYYLGIKEIRAYGIKGIRLISLGIKRRYAMMLIPERKEAKIRTFIRLEGKLKKELLTKNSQLFN